MIPHCSSDLHFSISEWCWGCFHVFVGHLHDFFGEMSISVFCPSFLSSFFLFFKLSYTNSLYNLEVNSLSAASFVIIFPYWRLSFLFVCLFMVSFVVKKLWNLIRSHLFIYLFCFVFIFITLGGKSESTCFNLCQRVFSLGFPLRVL